ncbi:MULTISPECIES: hypothetical protein [unclassified Herbaspirillum]|nr:MULTISPECIES: hypothetical protein [unclassified Herbaspirillum]TFI05496.1 hypothetical protein E4P32_20395 [Herbaspirillum sp. 3R11]TFI13594.1 hypothetical protein E4P31_18200 [Herbaspirillum sp. 3R-11]TFI27100.1 hypothetical protein E4P30_10470 [Herbaspirillum sp. 3C11]
MPIFGYAEFVAAMALFALIYTLTDTRYKFRAATSSVNLSAITQRTALTIGLGSLLTNLWYAQHLPIPVFLDSLPAWQTAFGFAFLAVMILWVRTTHTAPPVFNVANSRRFKRQLLEYVVSGNEKDLGIVARELIRSAGPIIEAIPNREGISRIALISPRSPAENMQVDALELMQLMATPRLCRAIAMQTNEVALVFLNEIQRQKKYTDVTALFSKNVTRHMFDHKESLLFYEDHVYDHGFLARTKYFTNAAFGSYDLVEGLGAYGACSPLDATPAFYAPFDEIQLKVFGRCYLLTVTDYCQKAGVFQVSSALSRATDYIALQTEYLSDGSGILNYRDPAYASFSTACRIFQETLKLLDKLDGTRWDAIAAMGSDIPFHELFAQQMFEIIGRAAHIRSDEKLCWEIQHNTTWRAFYYRGDFSGPSENIRRILNRLIMSEVNSLLAYANFHNSKVLAMCLNVLGFVPPGRQRGSRQERTLSRALLSWTRKYFAQVHAGNPRLREMLLTSNMSYDAENNCLVRYHFQGLNDTIPTTKMYLRPAPVM